MDAYGEEEIREKLKGLPEWKVEGNNLVRVQTFPNYLDALEFVYKVGKTAESFDHHPDIFMNYKRVTVKYWTHKANGITHLDFEMAARVEDLVKEIYKPRAPKPAG